MTELLASLTGKEPLELQEFVLVLEKLSGHQSIDVRLAVEINKLAAEQIDSLDLDVEDTTATELYRALLARFAQDEERFTRSLGALSHHGHDEVVPKLLKRLESLNSPRKAWVLKRSVGRVLLNTNPPKSLMKHLRYRTVDSMLKREAVEELLAAAPFTESEVWAVNMQKLYKKLTPADFESRPITIQAMHSGRWGNLPKRGSIVGFVPQIGAVVVWPSPDGKSYSLALTVLILEAIKSVRAVAAWLEYHQVEPDFAAILIKTLKEPVSSNLLLANQPIAWQSFAYHLSKQKADERHHLLESRIQSDHLQMREPELELCQMEPELRWWLAGRFTGRLTDGALISFNIADVAINHANHRTPETASTNWLAAATMEELVARYMKNPWVEDSLLSQLEGGKR